MDEMVAAYLRVSTEDQEKGLESQRMALQTYLDGHGIKNVRWYVDRVSGKDTSRPAFQRMQRDIFMGQVKCVVCWKLDRISRSMRDGINVLTAWLEQGLRVVAVAQQFDFSGTVGQMIAGVLFAIAQMERENLRENTKRGMLQAKARGVRLGKRPKLFARDIVPLLRAGQSLSGAARTLGKSRPAIYAALVREKINPSTLMAEIRAANGSK